MTAIGGMNITTTVEGLERYPVNLRYQPRAARQPAALRQVLVPTPPGPQIPLGELTDISLPLGPPAIKSENARPNAWVYVDTRIGAVWLIYLLDYNLSVAVWVGMIALAGLYAETAIVLLLYLDGAYRDYKARGLMRNRQDLLPGHRGGLGQARTADSDDNRHRHDRPAAHPVEHGAGADVMKRIATPLVGGVVTSGAVVLLIYPIVYYIWRSRGLPQTEESL
jgi:Cu/Ag efflux pump CusA